MFDLETSSQTECHLPKQIILALNFVTVEFSTRFLKLR